MDWIAMHDMHVLRKITRRIFSEIDVSLIAYLPNFFSRVKENFCQVRQKFLCYNALTVFEYKKVNLNAWQIFRNQMYSCMVEKKTISCFTANKSFVCLFFIF
jgi:hypothetical protein